MGNIKNFSDFMGLYVEGFKKMTWGRTLWIIIFIKLFIMFAVLKVFFFPNFLNSKADTPDQKSEYVSKELTNRN
ncbi:DUF4492 domain-containing protein [Bacteroidales bacterium]|nr:DUF4492 domain-containing protein [Bacteroidales bacterium]